MSEHRRVVNVGWRVLRAFHTGGREIRPVGLGWGQLVVFLTVLAPEEGGCALLLSDVGGAPHITIRPGSL